MTAHRLVLAALALPIIAVGAVLWFLLPGSAGGMAFLPSQFAREAVLRPLYWEGHDATLRGYLHAASCREARCELLILSDQPSADSAVSNRTQDLAILPQHESGWHAFLRRLLPGLSAPISDSNQRRVTIVGRLVQGSRGNGMPLIRPNGL